MTWPCVQGIKATNNETFLPLFFDEHRYLVLMGAAAQAKAFLPAARFWSG